MNMNAWMRAGASAALVAASPALIALLVLLLDQTVPLLVLASSIDAPPDAPSAARVASHMACGARVSLQSPPLSQPAAQAISSAPAPRPSSAATK